MPRSFTLTRRVAFHETDLAGIVHFSNYFRWMEEVEHAFFRSLGLSVSMQHEGKHIGWPRVSAKCDYKGPAKFEDELELFLHITRVGDKSLTYAIQFRIGGKDIASGSVTSVCCEVKPSGEMISISIPKWIKDKFAE